MKELLTTVRGFVAGLSTSTILKIVAEMITAGSGILGLLTNFKKKKKSKGKNFPAEREVISVPGKIALVGIVLGFATSMAITLLEARAEKAAEVKHAHEFGILSRPLSDKMEASIYCYSLPQQ